MTDQRSDLDKLARSFIRTAFADLRREHVIPTPVYHPFVHVGRDYFGPHIRGHTFNALDRALTEAFPDRFSDQPKRPDLREFASTYVFSFLEACVARCGGRTQNFSANSPGVTESINELLAVLSSRTTEVVCCRFVAHLTTTSSAPVSIGDVEVIPEGDPEDPRNSRALQRRIGREIPGAWVAYNRGDPFVFDRPHALLIVRGASEESPYATGDELSRRLERFLLVARLLTAGTVHSYFEVGGTPTLVSPRSPTMREFRESRLGIDRRSVRRTVRLEGSGGAAFDALGKLIDAAEVVRAGMAATSFDVALTKFHGSYTRENEYEQLVDLATALEAILLGGDEDTEAVGSRLRSRAAAILATPRDSGRSVFDDVRELYSLRSKLVHGGQIKEKELRKIIGRISTVPAGAANDRFGVALGYAVDRLRDLVRRSILARLCLAAEPDPLWPFGGSLPVDAILAGDRQRAMWRARWHARLEELGVGAAPGPPRAAVDFLSPDDE